jgi:hypothetical protein
VGARIIEGFLAMRDHAEGTGSSFAACVAGMTASTSMADAMREFVAKRVWGNTPVKEGESDSPTRHALVSSQLMGLNARPLPLGADRPSRRREDPTNCDGWWDRSASDDRDHRC